MQFKPTPTSTAPAPAIERRARPRHQTGNGHLAPSLYAAVPGLEVRESSWAEWDAAHEQLSTGTAG